MLPLTLLALGFLHAGAALKPPVPSAGCHAAEPPTPHGQLLQRTIHVTDGNFSATPRHYALHVPAGYAHGVPAALLLYFHMQDESPDDAALTEYESLGDQHGFFVVYPEGHSAGGTKDTECGPAWNVGTNGDNRTCTRQAYSPFGCPSQVRSLHTTTPNGSIGQ
jgi:hypothetical protein